MSRVVTHESELRRPLVVDHHVVAPNPMASTDDLTPLLRRLADRERVRSEATVQADVRQLLLTAGLGLAEQGHHRARLPRRQHAMEPTS